MRKGLIKAGVLLLLFVGTAAGTLWYINRGTTQETREMAEPTLPVLYMEVEDTLVNPMYGYADEMEEQYIRDSLTPLSTGRELTMIVEPMGSKVEAVNYRVSTADGSTVVEEGKIRIQPYPDPRLGYARAVYDSPYGTIISGWEYRQDKIVYHIEIPANMMAEILIEGLEKRTVDTGIYDLEICLRLIEKLIATLMLQIELQDI